jgi:hypothetical protein
MTSNENIIMYKVLGLVNLYNLSLTSSEII